MLIEKRIAVTEEALQSGLDKKVLGSASSPGIQVDVNGMKMSKNMATKTDTNTPIRILVEALELIIREQLAMEIELCASPTTYYVLGTTYTVRYCKKS